MKKIPKEYVPLNTSDYQLMINKIMSISGGIIKNDSVPSWQLDAAVRMQQLSVISQWSITCLSIFMASILVYWGFRRVSENFNARPVVETIMERMLLASACIAIFTTIGIIFSVLFESIQFSEKFLYLISFLVWSGVRKLLSERIKWVHLEVLAQFLSCWNHFNFVRSDGYCCTDRLNVCNISC